MIASLRQITQNKKVLVLADQAAFSGTNFGTTLLAARILSPVDFGIFSSLVLFLYLLISVSNSLIIQPLQVSITTVENKKAYASFCFLGQFAITIVLGIITIGVINTPLELTNGLSQHSMLIAIYVFSMLFHDYHRKAFLAQDRILQAVIIDTTTGIIQLGGLVFLLLSKTEALVSVLTTMAFSYVPSLLISLALSKLSLQFRSSWGVFISMHIDQGKWLLFTSIMQWWANNLFMVASGVFLGAKALGALRLVQSFFGILNLLLQILENYALPKAARLFKNSKEQSKLFLRQISIGGSAIFGVMLIILFVFSEQIITLAGGEQYVEFAFLVKGMALLYFVIFIGYPIRMSIRVMLMNRQFLIGYLISFVFSLATFQYLLSVWHLKGAILGLITNQLLMLLYWQYLLIKKDFILWK